MSKFRSKSLATVLGWVVLLASGYARAEEAGFSPLFNGKDLSGWKMIADKGDGAGEWSVADGVLVAKPGHSWLASEQQYGDFVLRLDWRVPENGNSGVFIRAPKAQPGEKPWEAGMEIQVLDDRGPQYKGVLKPWQYSGSIYGVVSADQSAYRGAGEWNACEITCHGDQVKVVLNGKTVAEGDMSQLEPLRNRPRSGYIGLQNHGTAVEYRNVRLKQLK